MAQKFKERLLQGTGVSNKKFESDYAMKLMQKMGWNQGQGLGKNKDGQTDCVQIERRADQLAVSYPFQTYSLEPNSAVLDKVGMTCGGNRVIQAVSRILNPYPLKIFHNQSPQMKKTNSQITKNIKQVVPKNQKHMHNPLKFQLNKIVIQKMIL